MAYDYNSQEPRFFSKYFSHNDPLIYDVPVGNATGASAAAPTFFDPKVNKDGYGFTEMQIDGGIICNNPALYAYELAKNYRGHDKIRVISLGTGEKPFKAVDPDDMNVVSYMSKSSEFMMNMDTYSADNYPQTFIPDPKNNYLRMQTTTSLGMDKIDKKSIEGLIKDGNKLWKENEENMKKILRDIIDERFAN